MFHADPPMRITVGWPQGYYAFPEPSRGCPAGFSRGCRYHDTEDSRNTNRFSNQRYLRGTFGRNILMCFCVKTANTRSDLIWRPGRYCIARSRGRCPSGFTSGWTYWDDEDNRNTNRRSGTLPDGSYGRDTRRYFCCRSDGSTSTPIILPTSRPFVLYQYRTRGCQRVAGMTAREIYVRYDDEDTRNSDSCSRGPYDPGCRNNHMMFMCHYS